MLTARIHVFVEIGQRVDLRMLFVAVVVAEHVDLHLAEIACESRLGRWRRIDIAKEDQLIVEESFIDLGEYYR